MCYRIHLLIGLSSIEKKTSSFWSRHFNNGYSPSSSNSLVELMSHSSEATNARWASENARWTWNIRNAFRPTLFKGLRGSSTHIGSNLPDGNCCFCEMLVCVLWKPNCRCRGWSRFCFEAELRIIMSGNWLWWGMFHPCTSKFCRESCASWERKKYCLVRTLMPVVRGSKQFP